MITKIDVQYFEHLSGAFASTRRTNILNSTFRVAERKARNPKTVHGHWSQASEELLNSLLYKSYRQQQARCAWPFEDSEMRLRINIFLTNSITSNGWNILLRAFTSVRTSFKIHFGILLIFHSILGYVYMGAPFLPMLNK